MKIVWLSYSYLDLMLKYPNKNIKIVWYKQYYLIICERGCPQILYLKKKKQVSPSQNNKIAI